MIPAPNIKYQIDINKYRKGKRINKGGFGTVYEAIDKATKKVYAAKIIDCGDNSEQCQKMIPREIDIMIRTKHPTIIKFYGYSLIDFHGENNVTIIMEYATNKSLKNVLEKIQGNDGPKNYTNTTRQIILLGVSRGMKYLHEINIIHRDLKPDNILLNDEFQPLITDFGFSKVFEPGHSFSQSQNCGTLTYTAPEILDNKKYDRKVDVYSFGITMFEVVTDSVTYPDLFNKKIKDYTFPDRVVNENYRPQFIYPIKQEFKDLIELCWSGDPNNRPSFNEIFNFLSKNFLEDVDVEEVNNYIYDITANEKKIEPTKDESDKSKQSNKKDSIAKQTIKSSGTEKIPTTSSSSKKDKTSSPLNIDSIKVEDFNKC